MNQVDPSVISCTNCQAVVTHDGKTVWICENCGTQNPPQPPTVIEPAPESPLPDVTAAQAAIADAAAAAGAPLAPNVAPGEVGLAPITPPAPTESSGMKTIPLATAPAASSPNTDPSV